jgi:ketosteroid isomerase-like protein
MTTPDEVRRSIENQNTKAIRAYASGDADALASIVAEDAWQMPPNLPAVVGRSAIREFWRGAFGWGQWNFTFETQSVSASGPMAVERGKYVLRFTAGPGAPPGMSSFEDRGDYLVHWRQEGDKQWRVVADAPVSELPLPGSPS